MKRFLGLIATAAGVLALSGVVTAQGGPGPGMMGGRGMGWRGGEGPCSRFEGASASQVSPISEEKAKEVAQEYADKYLSGFTVERVLPFTGRRHTMYSVELKNAQGELRVLRVNPFGNVMPFGGPGRRGA
ncbi:MAG: PepSY domain-containing protein [Deltaproteobacteria bacterium]|nr:PepSY domain-containing protein [Deltaproteobacteria bacterium]